MGADPAACEASARGEQPLEAALSDLASALNAIGVPWMITGGIAVIARACAACRRTSMALLHREGKNHEHN